MTFSNFVNNLIGLINYLIPVIFLLSFIVFVWGIIIYLGQSGNEGERKKGIQYMVYGIIGLTVMFSVWGIIELLTLSLFGSFVEIPLF